MALTRAYTCSMKWKPSLLKNAAIAAGHAPKALYNHARNDPQKTKRVIKTGLALTIAVGLTLPPSLADFLGENPFLVGTIVRSILLNPSTPASLSIKQWTCHVRCVAASASLGAITSRPGCERHISSK
jgi:hypothetical protein